MPPNAGNRRRVKPSARPSVPVEVAVLPVRVRPVPFELPEHFEERVREANSLTPTQWATWMNPHLRAVEPGDQTMAEALLELAAGLRAGHFARDRRRVPSHPDGESCGSCLTGLNGRWACVGCTHGAHVPQIPHDGARVCIKHMRWTGPGTLPASQIAVSADVVAADRAYRRLRARGVLDNHLLSELQGCVRAWGDSGQGRVLAEPEAFVLAVSIARRLLRGRKTGSPLTAFARDRVEDVVRSTVHGAASVLVDALLISLWGCSTEEATHAHRYWTTEVPQVPIDGNGLSSCAYPRARHLHLSQFQAAARGGSRFARAEISTGENTYRCPLGHPWNTNPSLLKTAGKLGGCPYCARRRVLAGFNSLQDTHPDLAARWDIVGNGTRRPTDVLSGSNDEVLWLCDGGHSFPKTVREMVVNPNCGYCSNHVVHPEINSLAALRPDIAATWHPTRNGELTPSDLIPTTDQKVWWLCEKGHDYELAPLQRTMGRGCRFCIGRALHPDNCLATVRPDLAAEWHPTMNGLLTPFDVKPSYDKPVWWQCSLGDAYAMSPGARRRGRGCSVCAGKVVNLRTCMATTHPDLAKELDEDLNGEITAWDVAAGTNLVLMWKCDFGHRWPAPGDRRKKLGTGCPTCANRVLLVGFNDMATTDPHLVPEWSERNGDLRPCDVITGARDRRWWVCTRGHHWKARGTDRKGGHGCRRCARMKD